MTPKTLVLVLTLSVVSGCARFRTIEECEALIHRINPTLDQIASMAKSPTETPEKYRNIAKTYEALAKDLEGRQFSSPLLAKSVGDYQRLLQDTAKNARKYAQGLEGNKKRKQRVAKLSSSKHVHRQKILIQRMNQICHPR